jgi:hypothetical protein
VRNSAHPESTTFLAANHGNLVSVEAGTQPNLLDPRILERIVEILLWDRQTGVFLDVTTACALPCVERLLGSDSRFYSTSRLVTTMSFTKGLPAHPVLDLGVESARLGQPIPMLAISHAEVEWVSSYELLQG